MQQLAPLLLIFVAFWFLVIRPTRKKQKEVSQLQSSLSVGSEVMMGSGIFGRVLALGDETVELEVAPGTVLKVARQAVVRVVEPEVPADASTLAPDLETENDLSTQNNSGDEPGTDRQ